MKDQIFCFKLERPARKQGGDRYKAQGRIDDFSIYVPQEISRSSGQPAKELWVTFSEKNPLT